jgi:putative serine/threonine protein kinase
LSLPLCEPVPLDDYRVASAICYPRPSCPRDPGWLAGHGVIAVCNIAGGTPLLGGLRVVGKGHAGVVLAALHSEGYVAVKVLRLDSKRESLEWEARLQLEASRAGAAPRVLAWSEWFVVSELVEGPSLGELAARGEPPEWAVVEALRAARALDAAGVLHHEIHRPWRNVLYTTSKALIVDYESASRGCGNVPKILAGLASRHRILRGLLGELRGMLRDYKERECPQGVYREIEEAVRDALARVKNPGPPGPGGL